jgi:hypothetical protein
MPERGRNDGWRGRRERRSRSHSRSRSRSRSRGRGRGRASGGWDRGDSSSDNSRSRHQGRAAAPRSWELRDSDRPRHRAWDDDRQRGGGRQQRRPTRDRSPIGAHHSGGGPHRWREDARGGDEYAGRGGAGYQPDHRPREYRSFLHDDYSDDRGGESRETREFSPEVWGHDGFEALSKAEADAGGNQAGVMVADSGATTAASTERTSEGV